jgi:hypothetical protein
MEITIESGTAYFCLAHVEPLFDLPDYFNLIKTQDFLSSHKGNSYSLKSYLARNNLEPRDDGHLSEYSWGFLLHLLSGRNLREVTRVSVSLHRKVVVSANIGRTSVTYLPGYLGMNVITRKELPIESLRVPLDTGVLVMPPVSFTRKVVGQYASSHSLCDFLLSLAICQKCGVLSDEDILSFINQEIFFPCLLVGTFPRKVFIEIGSKIEAYVIASENSGIGDSHEPGSYQSRARAFFIERLASYLFSKHALDIGVFKTNSDGTLGLNHKAYGYCLTILPDESGDDDYQVGR